MGLSLVISDYIQKRILKRFKVTPISHIMILAVQVIIYTIYFLLSLILDYWYFVLVLLQGFLNGSRIHKMCFAIIFEC